MPMLLQTKILLFMHLINLTITAIEIPLNRRCSKLPESSTLRCFEMKSKDFSTIVFNEDIENLECVRCNLGNIPAETFDFEDNHLFTLSLQNNNITGLVPFSFVGLSFMRKLDLCNNTIQVLMPGTFKGIKNVVILYLRRNKIRTLEKNTFWELINLERLDLSYNLISDIYPGAFNNLIKLQLLVLENNKIVRLPSELNFPENIAELHLSNNFINELRQNQFKVNSLSRLYLSNNNITVIPNNCFASSNIKEIYLNNNKIHNLEVNSFSGLKSLKQLHLENNSIEIIPFGIFSQLMHLETLDISQNKLEMFQFTLFTPIPELKYINLSYNSINKLVPGKLRKLYNLNSLDMSFNNLSYLDYEELMENAPKLILLYVNNNKLPCYTVQEMISYFSEDNFILNVQGNDNSSKLCNITKKSVLFDDLEEIKTLLWKTHSDHDHFPFLYALIGFLSILICIIAFIQYKTAASVKNFNKRNPNGFTDSNNLLNSSQSYEFVRSQVSYDSL